MQAVQNAKQKQKDAKDECKKLEKDMNEFKNNKEGKTEELKVGHCPSLSYDLSLCAFVRTGRDPGAEGSTPEACSSAEDFAEGVADGHTRGRYVLSFLTRG